MPHPTRTNFQITEPRIIGEKFKWDYAISHNDDRYHKSKNFHGIKKSDASLGLYAY